MNGLILDSLDPTYNLALEQHLFDNLTPDMPGWFLLWHNGPSIIVGRHQNTVQEVNQELVQRFDLPVVRRMTGGGAVYHDAGNLNFSFLQPHIAAHTSAGSGPLDFGVFLRPIVEALADLGFRAEFSSRNDLIVGGRKVSGSAQLRRPHGVLHHGTLLVDLDMDMLSAVLTGAPDKYLSKGISSIRSRVANLSEFLPGGDAMARIKAALMQRCASAVSELPASAVTAATALAEARYRTWDWNYGNSPLFTASWRERFAWGAVECCLEVRKGRIASCRIFGDFFSQREGAELESLLCGVRYDGEAVRAALADLSGEAWDSFFAGCDAAQMRAFFCRC